MEHRQVGEDFSLYVLDVFQEKEQRIQSFIFIEMRKQKFRPFFHALLCNTEKYCSTQAMISFSNKCFQKDCNRDQFWSIVDIIDSSCIKINKKDILCVEMELSEEDVEKFTNSEFLSEGI